VGGLGFARPVSLDFARDERFLVQCKTEKL
jgi:hypothetical protein